MIKIENVHLKSFIRDPNAAVLYMNDTLYAILNKSENATLLYFIFCEKILDEKYLLKINSAFSRHPASDSSKLRQFVPLMFELCSLL